MSQAQYTGGGVTPPVEARAFDADLNFLVRWAGPLGLLPGRCWPTFLSSRAREDRGLFRRSRLYAGPWG
jgi:hypothetical protein